MIDRQLRRVELELLVGALIALTTRATPWSTIQTPASDRINIVLGSALRRCGRILSGDNGRIAVRPLDHGHVLRVVCIAMGNHIEPTTGQLRAGSPSHGRS